MAALAKVGSLRAYEHSLIEHVGSQPSAVQRVRISRAARLALHLELMDRRSLTNFGMSDRDSRQYLAWSNSLSRVLAHVGLAATTQPLTAVSAPCTPQRVTSESAAEAYFQLLHAKPDAG
jgi:hypothetical protein